MSYGAWMTPGEAGDFLGMTAETVRAMVRRGELDGGKTRSGRFRISRRSVEDWSPGQGRVMESEVMARRRCKRQAMRDARVALGIE